MAQIIVDEQLDEKEVLEPLRRLYSVRRIQDLRPGEHILDDRVPAMLSTVKKPTFITIDQGFWDRGLCSPHYCIFCFVVRLDQQAFVPEMLRALFRRPEFRTTACRMGKVAHISASAIEYWEFPVRAAQRLAWKFRPKTR